VQVNDIEARDARVAPGTTGADCQHVRVYVTGGALQALPPAELQALFAHELAHVHRGHTIGARQHTVVRGGGRGSALVMEQDRVFTAEEESTADAFAA